MYYFVNGRSAEIIEDCIASEGFGYFTEEFMELEGELHSAIEELARGFESSGRGSSAKIKVPKLIERELADGRDDGWRDRLAKAVFLEAAEIYVGENLIEFKDALRKALSDLMVGPRPSIAK